MVFMVILIRSRKLPLPAFTNGIVVYPRPASVNFKEGSAGSRERVDGPEAHPGSAQ
jgi:hypothetical protein